MAKIIEFGSQENPEYPRSLSDAIILHNVGILRDGSDMNGKTLTDLINKLFVGADTFKFLHLSDTHKTNYGIPVAHQMLTNDDDLKFAIVTGDIEPTSAMIEYMQLSGKFYTMLGNHDVTNTNVTNIVATANVITPVCGDTANFGDVGGAGYWYKDYTTARGRSIRFIAFDEYEQSATNNSISGKVTYTKTQMDWFIDLLMNTPSDMFIVLCHHQAVATSRPSGYSNLFTSELAPNTYEQMGGNAEIIPTIVDAYTRKGQFVWSGKCGDTGGDSMSFNVDFSECVPAKMLMHIGGHTHWDVVEYLPNFPNQLQVLIDRDGGTYQYSDLTRTDAMYCINQYTINMETGDILIERIGAKRTQGGRTRTSIQF